MSKMPKIMDVNQCALELNEPNNQNEPYVFTGNGLLFGILVIVICLSFVICYLEFPLIQLL